MKAKGQILIIVAVLIPVTLLLLAVAVDSGRIFIERGRVQRAAQSGADAGISVVAEQMVTLAVARQTVFAVTPSPTPPGTMTATPPPGDVPAWLTYEDRATLVSSVIQSTAAAEAREYVRLNGFDPGDPQIELVEVTFPQPGYDPADTSLENLSLFVRIRRRTTVLLAGLLGESLILLESEAQSEIPQR
ncbi:MAG: Tad domain-containing protein [Anaerolineales bacterium]|nr:Tad domain-containing protein [Anaerolineales bacterium]